MTQVPVTTDADNTDAPTFNEIDCASYRQGFFGKKRQMQIGLMYVDDQLLTEPYGQNFVSLGFSSDSSVVPFVLSPERCARFRRTSFGRVHSSNVRRTPYFMRIRAKVVALAPQCAAHGRRHAGTQWAACPPCLPAAGPRSSGWQLPHPTLIGQWRPTALWGRRLHYGKAERLLNWMCRAPS